MTVLDFSPTDVALVLYQGDNFSKTFRFGSRPSSGEDIVYWDLTGWTGLSQIRAKAKSEDVLASLTVVIGSNQTDPDFAGYVFVSLSNTDSTNLPRRCFWDLELTDADGYVRTLLAGEVAVTREITRL